MILLNGEQIGRKTMQFRERFLIDVFSGGYLASNDLSLLFSNLEAKRAKGSFICHQIGFQHNRERVCGCWSSLLIIERFGICGLDFEFCTETHGTHGHCFEFRWKWAMNCIRFAVEVKRGSSNNRNTDRKSFTYETHFVCIRFQRVCVSRCVAFNRVLITYTRRYCSLFLSPMFTFTSVDLCVVFGWKHNKPSQMSNERRRPKKKKSMCIASNWCIGLFLPFHIFIISCDSKIVAFINTHSIQCGSTENERQRKKKWRKTKLGTPKTKRMSIDPIYHKYSSIIIITMYGIRHYEMREKTNTLTRSLASNAHTPYKSNTWITRKQQQRTKFRQKW